MIQQIMDAARDNNSDSGLLRQGERRGFCAVVGMSQADAEATLTTAGLIVGVVSQELSDTIPDGQVMEQYPVAGTNILTGGAVSLVVSSGARIASPDGFTAQGGLDRIRLRWDANTEDTLSGYRIYRRAEDEESFSLLASVTTNTTQYEDADVQAGLVYYYQLTAFVAGGEESDYAGPVSAKAGVVALDFDDIDLPESGCDLMGLNISDTGGATMTGFGGVRFDPAVIDSTTLSVQQTAITRGLTITPFVDVRGSVTLTVSSEESFSLAGSGRLFNIQVCAREGALSGTCTELMVTSATFAFTDNIDLETDLSGVGLMCIDGVCGGPGDLNSDSQVTQTDAETLLDIAVRAIKAEPCHWKTELNGDDLLNCADA